MWTRVHSRLATRLLGAAAAIMLPAACAGGWLAHIHAGPGVWAIIMALSVAVLIVLGLALRIMLAPLEQMRDQMRSVSLDLAQHEMFSDAQNSLDRNLGLLREALFTNGEPRRQGDQLFFGRRLINDDFDAVDHVSHAAGGTATVFLGDVRVATNVTSSDGTRATGTTLAPGVVYDTVLTAGRGYRGEADVLGESYFTVYEPILSDGVVIGALYVGVKKAEFAARLREMGARGSGTDALKDMRSILSMFQQAAAMQVQAEHAAISSRQQMEDARRRQELARQTGALGQRRVVEALSDVLERISAGDLSRGVEDDFPPDYATLKQNFNAALSALRDTLGAITEGCRAMQHGTEEIRTATDDLAHRTERQATTLEHTATALDRITATVRRSAEGADHAGRLVTAARGAAEASGDVMQQAVAAMDRIQGSSEQIGHIIGVIDEIAFQTNLLALNAGVEAARAGDAGRGFAVVASEVRALAQRSTAAAREIKGLIMTSCREVTGGAAVVRQTGEALVAIAGQVIEINRVVLDIAGSAREQAQTLDQVNSSVNEMDRVTQQNAAMVEQTTAASAVLAKQAEELTHKAERFRTEPPSKRAPKHRTQPSLVKEIAA